MKVNANSERLLRIDELNPGDTFKLDQSYFMVTTKTANDFVRANELQFENPDRLCVKLDSGAIIHFEADKTVKPVTIEANVL